MPPISGSIPDGHKSADARDDSRSPRRTGSSQAPSHKVDPLSGEFDGRKPGTTKSLSQPKKIKSVVSHRASDAHKASEKISSKRSSLPEKDNHVVPEEEDGSGPVSGEETKKSKTIEDVDVQTPTIQ